MSYATIEAAAVSVLQLHADFSTNNCRAGDLSPVKKGYERVVRFLYGGAAQAEVTLQIQSATWTVWVDLYVPYRGELPEFEGRLATERQKVIDQFNLYPRLNACAGVRRARIITGEPPAYLQPKKSAYRGQRLTLQVIEHVKPARVEA